jgi:hypothetical protein
MLAGLQTLVCGFSCNNGVLGSSGSGAVLLSSSLTCLSLPHSMLSSVRYVLCCDEDTWDGSTRDELKLGKKEDGMEGAMSERAEFLPRLKRIVLVTCLSPPSLPRIFPPFIVCELVFV